MTPDERRRGRVVDGLLHGEASSSVERGRHSATRRDLTFRLGRGGLEKTSDSTTPPATTVASNLPDNGTGETGAAKGGWPPPLEAGRARMAGD